MNPDVCSPSGGRTGGIGPVVAEFNLSSWSGVYCSLAMRVRDRAGADN